MSLVRRFRVGLTLMAVVTAITVGVAAGPAGANTVPTVPVTVPEAGVSTQALDNSGFVADVNAVQGRGPSDAQVLDSVLAQTGSSTGILVISGVILFVVGGSLVGGRRVYGD